jgi:hypothetical protein
LLRQTHELLLRAASSSQPKTALDYCFVITTNSALYINKPAHKKTPRKETVALTVMAARLLI